MAKNHKVDNIRIVQMQQGAISSPHASYKGTKPAKGDTLEFQLEDGVTYTGTVNEVTEVDGDVLVNFTGTPQPK